MDVHPIDTHIASLNLAVIEPLDHSSEEFQALEEYAQNTHGDTHNYYKVEVEEIFRIQRRAEEEQGLPTEPGERLLLWHGSRSTNFAGARLLIGIDESNYFPLGILMQGLRITPPEAPVTGYVRVQFSESPRYQS